MEILIIIFKLLSAMIETIIVLYFGSIVTKERISIITPIISGILMLISSLINIPWIGKIIYFLILILCLLLIEKINIIQVLKTILFGLIFLITLETIYAISFEFILSIDLSLINQEMRLLLLIPLRIIQITIIISIRRYLKHGNFVLGRNQ